MSKVWCGIDNGVTGSIGIIKENERKFVETPVRHVLSYQTSKIAHCNRIDFFRLLDFLRDEIDGNPCFLLIERPLNNSKRYRATLSAMRSFEATLLVIETLQLPYEVIDSKPWQKSFFAPGTKGSSALKEASLQKGLQLFPELEEEIKKHSDADGILIAEYARRNNL